MWVDDDDITAKAFALADNRTADLGTYDDENLLTMLQAVHDADASLFAATAYDDEALTALVASLEPDMTTPGRNTDPGDLPAEPITKPGDLILLGEHRLLCGDSTADTDVERLLGGATVDLIVTDPPFGLGYVGKTADALTIQNDALGDEGTRQLIAKARGYGLLRRARMPRIPAARPRSRI